MAVTLGSIFVNFGYQYGQCHQLLFYLLKGVLTNFFENILFEVMNNQIRHFMCSWKQKVAKPTLHKFKSRCFKQQSL